MQYLRNLSIKWKCLLAVGIPVVGLLLYAASFYGSSRDFDRSSEWVDHSHEVRLTITRLDAHLSSAESVTRGYALTRSDMPGVAREFLIARDQLIALIEGDLRTLRSLVRDNAAQLQTAAEIERLTRLRIGVLQSVSSVRTPREMLDRLVDGKSLMERIRAGIGRMSAVEDRLLAERMQRMDRQRGSRNRILQIGALLGLIGGLTGIWLVTASVTRRVFVLENIAWKLAAGEPVTFRPKGKDELERLGQALASASDLLRDREDALRQRKQLYKLLAENAADIIYRCRVSPQPFAEYISPSIYPLTGYRPDEFYENPELLYDVVLPEDRKLLTQVFQSDTPDELFLLRLRHRDGHTVFTEQRIRRMQDESGQVVTIEGIGRDVSQRMEMEYEILEARSAAEKANHAKSEFLSRMSHELRTPLNAILGFTQLLELDALTEEQKESTTQILRAGKHLLALINEVLDVTRIESGRLSLSPEPVLVREVASEAADLTMHLAHNLGVRVAVDESHDGISVRADRQRLKQVMVNLVSNAVKYNRPNGSVVVSCRPVAEDRARIEVTDSGIGISKDKIDRLFVPFDRLGAEQTEVEGTGLGLVVARRLLEVMGGRLGVESTVGVGTTFWIELPIAESPVEVLERQSPPPVMIDSSAPSVTSGFKVLYIEDNASNARLMERFLERWPKTKLIVATTGREGMRLAATEQPDVILLDLHLPDASGADLLRRLKASEETAQTPVVVVSADATPGQMQRLLQSGAFRYLTKPLDLNELQEALTGVREPKGSRAA